MRPVVLVTYALIALCNGPSQAANFTMLCDTGFEQIGGCAIKLTGQIVPGDAERFVAALKVVPPHTGMYRTLLLESPGGDISESLKIADLVRRAVLETANYRATDGAGKDHFRESRFACVSACFVVWAAGAKRSYMSSNPAFESITGRFGIGLHRPYFSAAAYQTGDPAAIAKRQQDATEMLRTHLRREAIPDQLIEEMIRRSSREVLWLDKSQYEISDAAPWFEELLIAKCNFDPAYERQIQVEQSEMLVRSLRTNKPMPDPMKDASYNRYVAWKQTVNGCLYNQIMIPAQAALRR